MSQACYTITGFLALLSIFAVTQSHAHQPMTEMNKMRWLDTNGFRMSDACTLPNEVEFDIEAEKDSVIFAGCGGFL